MLQTFVLTLLQFYAEAVTVAGRNTTKTIRWRWSCKNFLIFTCLLSFYYRSIYTW